MEIARKYVSVLLLLVLCFTFSFSALAAPVATPSQIQIVPEDIDAVKATPSILFSPSRVSGLSESNSVLDWSASIVNYHYHYENEPDTPRHTVSVHPDSDGTFVIPVLYSDPVYGSPVGDYLEFILSPDNLPNAGTYSVSFTFSSDVGVSYVGDEAILQFQYSSSNAENAFSRIGVSCTTIAGGFNCNATIDIGYSNYLYVYRPVTTLPPIGGKLFCNFVRSESAPSVSAPNAGSSSSDIQDNINNTVGGISSGVSDINGSIRDLIQTIISQLDALWNQFAGEFTNMFAAWQTHTDAIVSAIQNITTTASDGIENIIQGGHNDADQISGDIQDAEENITNGYDNSGMTSDNDRLDSSLQEYDSAEDALISDAEDAINGVDFNIDLTSFSGIIATISGFLQDCYENSGQFQIVINLTLLCSLASCVIGLYRFKGGG